MKRIRCFILGIVLLAGAVCASGVAAATLFYDGFDADKGSNDVGYQLVERQTGSMAPRTYEERVDTKWAQDYDLMTQLTLWSSWGRTTNELDLGAGNHWGIPNNEFTWVSPNANFNTTDKYEIVVKMSCWAYSGGSNESQRYTGILFGADAQGQRPDASTTGFGFVITGNYKPAASGGEPSWKLYDRGAMVASGYMGGPGPGYWEEIHLTVDNTGSTTRLNVNNYNVAPLVTDYVSSYKLSNNRITLAGAYLSGTDTSLWAMFDDLTVIDTSSAGLTGTVDLQDYTGDKTAIGVRLQFLQAGTLIATKSDVLDASGSYDVSGLTPGVYDVTYKTSQSLSTVVTGVTVPGTQNVSLTNGDVDGDDHITSTDLSVVISNLE